MPAIAITDHGVVQAFPDANKVWQDCWSKECAKRKEAGEPAPDKQDFFKVIYGVEAYLVDDLVDIAVGVNGQSMDQTYVVFDLETTGFSPVNDHIIEIGAVRMEKDQIIDRFSTFVNPGVPIPYRIEKLTSINDQMVSASPSIEEVLPKFLEFCKGCVLVAHNARFDVGFIRENCRRMGLPTEYPYVDTMGISRAILPDQSKHTLDALVKVMGVKLNDHHRAVNDAEATAELFLKFLDILEDEKHITDFDALNKMGSASPAAIKHMKTYHAIILAKNNTGRVNLYHLISESHINYFARRPRISKSMFMKYREGLILGSACEAGELYQALEEGQSDDTIERIVSFYDYLEIQPCGNNLFLIASEKVPQVKSLEDIRNINRKIVKQESSSKNQS
jgi:DNA polymerase-3 subunit alpha (Gram-positive type)